MCFGDVPIQPKQGDGWKYEYLYAYYIQSIALEETVC